MKMILAGLIAALILAGCGPENPIPDSTESDWCYVFDFTNFNANGFMILDGSMTADGILSDAGGVMRATFQYDRDVNPQLIIATIARPDTTTGDVPVVADGLAFGESFAFESVFPSLIDVATMAFGAYSESEWQRDKINFHIESDQPILFRSLELRGGGSNPFPANFCGPQTSTPTPPGGGDGTTTATPSQSPTAGPTSTEIPSVTWDWYLGHPSQTSDWTFMPSGITVTGAVGTNLNNATTGGSDPSFFNHGLQASPTSGIGHFIKDFGDDVTITSVQIGWRCSACDHITVLEINDVDIGEQFINNSSRNAADYENTNEFVAIDGIVDIAWSGVPWLDFVRITYRDGITPTPGPTATGGPTATFEPLWGSCLDFTIADFSFTAQDGRYEPDYGFFQEWTLEFDGVWSFGRSGLVAGAKKKIKLTFLPGQVFDGYIRLTDNGTNATDWIEVAPGNTVIADFSESEWHPNNTFWVEFQDGPPGQLVQSLCWLDPNPATPTPGPGTGTPLYTRTPLALTLSPTYAPSRTPIGIPNPYNVITSTPGVSITTTPIYSGTGVYVITGTPFGTPSGGGSGTGSTGGTGGSGGTGSNSGDAGGILGFGWSIGAGMFGAGAAYLGEAGDVAGGMLSTFTEADPIGIPGLPMCMTNPMAHDICAIYYILDFTIFAEGTPGALIIPFLLVIMNFYIVIRFVRWAMRIVKRSEGITDAN